MNVIRDYKEWNDALWGYFFPQGNENPILYLDDNIIKQIGEEAKITCISSWENDFLSKSLLSPTKINEFTRDWFRWTGERGCSARNWTHLVDYLKKRQLGSTPAYFAMLCAVMYLACTRSTNHDAIRTAAQSYLGDNYSKKPGELVDDLLYALYCDKKSFDPDRMTCGTQRNMSRIKFHTVLKPADREDFIDFLEINNLKWEYEAYADYINYRLIPALSCAGKHKLIEFVKDSQYVPCVKSILQDDLKFGKQVSKKDNTVQIVPITWKYELYFDLDGNPSFYIATDTRTPFAIELKEGLFHIDSSHASSDYIASEVDLKQYQSQKITYQGLSYEIKNIAQDLWKNEIIFEKVSDDCYQQISEPSEGREYIKLVRTKLKQNVFAKLTNGWEKSAKHLSIDCFDVYETDCFAPQNSRTAKKTNQFIDKVKFYGIGRWFSVTLDDNQKVLWDKNAFDEEPEEVEVIKGKDGKYYFSIDRTSPKQLSGHVYVAKNNAKTIDSQERILVNFEWEGKLRKYYMNGWGEVSDKDTIVLKEMPLLKKYIQRNGDNSIEHGDMLLQILYDIADINGCVSQNEMKAALDFVLGFHNITPTKQNRRNLIYALRRLGYIIAYYNNSTKEYENQLCPAYLEKSNYSISVSNAFLVKGVYNDCDLSKLLDPINKKFIVYKRPYDMDSEKKYPEYVCLPDMILFEDNQKQFNGWKIIDYPIAASMIESMACMSEFEKHFAINENGDLWQTPIAYESVPCIVKNSHNKEILLTKKDGYYYSHSMYLNDENFNVPIPKHLSRTYCQNKNGHPACILEKDTQINYATIWFVSGMGRPEVFDAAFCDLNLGLPSNEYFFIVDQEESGIESKTSYVEGYKYSTLATDDKKDILKCALEKLGGKHIDSFEDSPSIFISKRQRAKGLSTYNMKLKKGNNFYPELILERNSHMIAFSRNKKVYYLDNVSNAFYEIGEGNVNKILSDVINSKEINWGCKYSGETPTSDNNDPNVHIIKKYNS